MEELLGDYLSFFNELNSRLKSMGIDIKGRDISHLAIRTETMEEYIVLRDNMEKFAEANIENEWNGRPISKLVLKEPLNLSDGHKVSLIEIIPPVHQDDYPMGLEHFGVVFGDDFEDFYTKHATSITGKQDQGPYNQPRYIRWEDNRMMVKFYEFGLREVVEKEGGVFDGFYHAK